jgi:hypothetical protein
LISISINFAFPHIWQKIEWKIAPQILKLFWIQNLFFFFMNDFLAELTIGFFIPTFCSGFWRSQTFWIIFYVLMFSWWIIWGGNCGFCIHCISEFSQSICRLKRLTVFYVGVEKGE